MTLFKQEWIDLGLIQKCSFNIKKLKANFCISIVKLLIRNLKVNNSYFLGKL